MNIPIEILNTNAPNETGTIICKDANDDTNLITGISGKKNYTSITILKNKQANKLYVIEAVLAIFHRYNVNLEHLPTSIDSFSVVVETRSIKDKIFEKGFRFPETERDTRYQELLCLMLYYDIENNHYSILGLANILFLIEEYTKSIYKSE